MLSSMLKFILHLSSMSLSWVLTFQMRDITDTSILHNKSEDPGWLKTRQIDNSLLSIYWLLNHYQCIILSTTHQTTDKAKCRPGRSREGSSWHAVERAEPASQVPAAAAQLDWWLCTASVTWWREAQTNECTTPPTSAQSIFSTHPF